MSRKKSGSVMENVPSLKEDFCKMRDIRCLRALIECLAAIESGAVCDSKELMSETTKLVPAQWWKHHEENRHHQSPSVGNLQPRTIKGDHCPRLCNQSIWQAKLVRVTGQTRPCVSTT